MQKTQSSEHSSGSRHPYRNMPPEGLSVEAFAEAISRATEVITRSITHIGGE